MADPDAPESEDEESLPLAQAAQTSTADTYADHGCLRAERFGDKVVVTKTSAKCNCSMDLANLAVDHAKELAILLHAVTRNV